MKRIKFGLVVGVLLSALLVSAAYAADSATVGVTIENAVASITIDKDTWIAPPLSLGNMSISDPFTLTNNGSVTVDLLVRGTNATMAGTANTWALSGDGLIGLDKFSLAWSPAADTGTNTYIATTTRAFGATSGLTAGANFPFKLWLSMPSSVTQRGAYTSQVFITATERPY